MITRRSVTALCSAERQWLRSGQCARCFHISWQQRTTESPPAIGESENPQKQNAPIQPRNPPSRQQRASMISNEVSMLERGPPPGDPTSGPGSLTGTAQMDRPPPRESAGFVDTPQSGPGIGMGANVSAGKEGPNAQGVGRVTGTDERVRNEHPRARSTRNPKKVQIPAEGGVSVMEATTPGPADQAARRASDQGESEDDVDWSEPQENELRQKLTSNRPQGVSYRPTKWEQYQARAHFLNNGRGVGVPLNGKFDNVIRDRFKLVADPVAETVSKPTENPARNRIHMVSERGARKGALRISQNARKKICEALVAGKYDPEGILDGKMKYKKPEMNDIAKTMMNNGTYARRDRQRLLSKIQSLLPAAVVAKSPLKKQQENAKA